MFMMSCMAVLFSLVSKLTAVFGDMFLMLPLYMSTVDLKSKNLVVFEDQILSFHLQALTEVQNLLLRNNIRFYTQHPVFKGS